MQAVALKTQAVNPFLKDTLDNNQKTFQCFQEETVKKWREALALRYRNNSDTESSFSVTWEDRDSANNVIEIPLNCTEPSQYNLAKTFIQIFRGDVEKCITITLYFIKKPTRKKGAGTCLIQGNQCQAWARNEFNILCSMVSTLLDSTMNADNVHSEHRAVNYSADNQALAPLPSSVDRHPAVVSDSPILNSVTDGTSSDDNQTSEDGNDAVPASAAVTVTVTASAESQQVTVTPGSPPPTDSDQHHQAEAQRQDDSATPSPIENNTPHTMGGITPPPMDSATPPPMESTTPPPIENTTPPPMDSATPPPMENTTPTPIENTTPPLMHSTTPSPMDSTNPSPIDSAVAPPMDSATSPPDSATSPPDSATSPPMDCDLSPPTQLDTAVQPADTTCPAVSALCSADGVTVSPTPPSLVTEPTTDPVTNINQTADNTTPDNDTETTIVRMNTETEANPAVEDNVCVQCQQSFATSVCRACIKDFDADLKSYMDHKLKLLTQTMQEQIDTLKEECGRLRILVKDQKKLIDSVSDRQKHILKQNIQNNKVLECTPTVQQSDKECQCHSEAASPPQVESRSATATGSSLEDRCVAASEAPSAVRDPHPVADTATVTTVNNTPAFNDQNHAPKYRIRLPPKGKIVHFIMGDSNLQYIDRNRLDKTGSTHVRTMPGAKVTDVTDSLRDSPVREDVQQVALLVGGNDVDKQYTVHMLKRDFGNLLLQIKKKFPAARIAVSALFPRKSVPLWFINSLNKELHALCVEKGACFLFEKNFVDQNQRTVKSCFSSDGIHLSATGLSLWLRQVIQFLALHADRPSRFNGERTKSVLRDNRATTREFTTRNQAIVEETPRQFQTSKNDRATKLVLPDSSHYTKMAFSGPVNKNQNSYQPKIIHQLQSVASRSNTAGEKDCERPNFQSSRESAPHQAMPPMPYFNSSPTPSMPMFPPMWPFPPFPPMPFSPWFMHRYFPSVPT